MRMLVLGAMAATLIGCSFAVPLQTSRDECSSNSCLDKSAAIPPIEPNPAVSRSNSATTPKKSATVAKATKASSSPSVQLDNRAKPVKQVAAAPTTAKAEDPAPVPPAEMSDSILSRAKASIAAKMEDPASAEFGDMNWAFRKNTFGQPVDTICGHVKGKNVAGADTGERPFLYLVTDDEAYVVDGNANSAAAIAYRNICN